MIRALEVPAPIIFIGAPRSGTTIISEYVLQHRALAWPSNYQEKFPRSVWINALRPLFDNAQWQLLGKKRQLHSAAALNRYLFSPGECYAWWAHLAGPEVNFRHEFMLGIEASSERRTYARRFVRRMTGLQRRARFACKLTGPARLGYLISLFPNALFINIRRRLVPTVSSLLHVWFWGAEGGRRLWWKGAYETREEEWVRAHGAQPALTTAFQILRIAAATRYEIERYAPCVLNVDYEEFTRAPDESLARILDFCGLDGDPRVLRYFDQNPVLDRNRDDTDYFDAATLHEIAALEARSRLPASIIDALKNRAPPTPGA